MKSLEAADLFDQIADLLEVRGDNPFRIRAYRRAALNLRNLGEDLETLAERGTLTEIPGIGKDLAAKILEVVRTGRLKYLEELKRQVPASLSTLMSIPGIGPKTAKLVYERFKVRSVDGLERLLRSGRLRKLPGWKEKKEANLLRGIGVVRAGQERMPLGLARELGRQILETLKRYPEVERISLAGSLRRCKETVRDIDVLITSRQPKRVMGRFVQEKFAAQVQAHGDTKSSIRTAQGTQVDLRVVDPEAFGAALVYFTGSKAHNIRIRSLANRKGLTINEYGVFREKSGRRIAGREEEDVYRSLGLIWIPPELREDLGEVEAVQSGGLPDLVERKDLLGSFHNHSDWSDGSHPLEEVAKAVRQQGYRYMLLSDHSRSLRVAGGLSESELLKQLAEVEKLNQRLRPFRILMGSEVDILPDGRLDYPDRVLSKLDLVIAAVHSAFRQPKEVMTRRIVRALGNPFVSILAHPTGRLLGEREPYEVDLEELFRVAAKNRVALEINCYTRRLDLNDVQSKRARELGAKLVISTDTHVLGQLEDIELGVALARRAWAGRSDVLNCLRVNKLLDWATEKRREG